MPKPTFVYLLVSLPICYMRRQNAFSRLENAYRKTREIRSPKKREAAQQKLREQRQRAKERHPASTPSTRGVFLSKADAIEAIEKYPGTIHEAGYYSHLVIERKAVGLESIPWGRGSETWFKLQPSGTYERCAKPKSLRGTVNFSG